MKNLFYLIFFASSCCYGQQTSLGIQVYGANYQKQHYTIERQGAGNFTYSPRLHLYNGGIFVEKMGEARYFRGAANLGVSNTKENNTFLYENDTSLEISIQLSRLSNRFAFEYGGIWSPTGRLRFLGGVYASLSFGYPKTVLLRIESFDSGTFTGANEIETKEGSAVNIEAGLALRVHYMISKHIFLGFAIQHGLQFTTIRQTAQRTNRQFDASGNLIEEFSEQDVFDNIGIQTTGPLLPVLIFGFNFGANK